MIITVVAFKGGVGKSTTAVHLAAYLQERAPTVLIDGDENRSASKWAGRGSFPFRVVDERQSARVAREYEHIVIDTQARPNEEDLKAFAEGCDLLVVPTSPDRMALDALVETVAALKRLQADRYRILITMVPPWPSHDGEHAQEALKAHGLPVLDARVSFLVAFKRAVEEGKLVYEVKDPRAQRGWDEYQSAFAEFIV